jgi:hypothetical protein
VNSPGPDLIFIVERIDQVRECLDDMHSARPAMPPFAAIHGTTLTHWDIRSDNICITSHCVKLIDRPASCLSNPKLDLGAARCN